MPQAFWPFTLHSYSAVTEQAGFSPTRLRFTGAILAATAVIILALLRQADSVTGVWGIIPNNQMSHTRQHLVAIPQVLYGPSISARTYKRHATHSEHVASYGIYLMG